MSIVYHKDLVQGSDEWLQARCGILTASEMKLIITPSMKPASNEKERAHLFELLAQRITKYVEPRYISDDMLRGHEDEWTAKALYSDNFSPVEDVGFITNDRWGFVIGYSPDGTVGDDGLIECKSRRQRFQIETIINNAPPDEYMIQLQTGLLVTERKWIDYISYSGGLPVEPIRVFPNVEMQQAIVNAAGAFEKRLSDKMDQYLEAIKSRRFIPTKRTIREEIF